MRRHFTTIYFHSFPLFLFSTRLSMWRQGGARMGSPSVSMLESKARLCASMTIGVGRWTGLDWTVTCTYIERRLAFIDD